MYSKRLAGLALTVFYIFMSPLPAMTSLGRGDFLPLLQVDNSSLQSSYYYVQKGDNLWQLAQKYHVSLGALLISNSNLNEKSILRIGDKIKIPPQGQAVHVVAQGETVWDIARKFDINEKEITKLNSSIKPESLKIGTELLIPGNVQRQIAMQPSRGYTQSAFFWPLAGMITSRYGWRKNEFHHGLDIAGEIGDVIRAAEKGTVHSTGFNQIYGRMIILDHEDGKQTLYAHARKINVKKGQLVQRGQVIAEVGVTGRTTGPHLHFEVRINGKALDPLIYLPK